MFPPIDLVRPVLDAITGVAAAAAQGNSAPATPAQATGAQPGNGELIPGTAGQIGAGPAPETSTPEPAQDLLPSLPESDED